MRHNHRLLRTRGAGNFGCGNRGSTMSTIYFYSGLIAAPHGGEECRFAPSVTMHCATQWE